MILDIFTLLLIILTVNGDEEWTVGKREKRVNDIISYYEGDTTLSRAKRQTAAVDIPDMKLGPNNGKKMRVVTILNTPYTMHDEENNKFIGFIPELFQLIGQRENIEFTMYLVKDGRYGYKKSDGTWAGMIGDLLKKQHDPTSPDGADIVGAPLTMSAAREEHIDFLNPFKSLGLGMVVKKANPKEYMPVNFAITDPLSTEVWLICTAATVLVGLLLFGINQFNPYEWSGRYAIGRATEQQNEAFNISGALWFAFTTLQWQGYERAPRSIASRILAVFWFTFVTITMITYTASLVNYLFWASTVHGKDFTNAPILDLEHLIMGGDYHYGCVKGGSTYKYLTDDRRGEIFKKIKQYLDTNPESLVSSSKEGFDRVRKGNYVFIAEEPSAIHEVNLLPCDLMITGKSFAPRSYSMAHRNNLPNQTIDQLHTSILEMLEDGTMEALEKKWFVDRGQCWNITKMERITSRQTSLNLNKPKKITLEQFWGPLVLIVVGMICSICAGIVELLYYKYKGKFSPENISGTAKLTLNQDENI